MNWKKWRNRALKVLKAAGLIYLLLAIGMAAYIVYIFIKLGS
jgi:uncharacterized membrane protein